MASNTISIAYYKSDFESLEFLAKFYPRVGLCPSLTLEYVYDYAIKNKEKFEFVERHHTRKYLKDKILLKDSIPDIVDLPSDLHALVHLLEFDNVHNYCQDNFKCQPRFSYVINNCLTLLWAMFRGDLPKREFATKQYGSDDEKHLHKYCNDICIDSHIRNIAIHTMHDVYQTLVRNKKVFWGIEIYAN